MKKNNIDGYIQLPKQSLNSQFQQLEDLSHTISERMESYKKPLRNLANSLLEISKIWTEQQDNIRDHIHVLTEQLQPIIKQIQKSVKVATRICIENGFYPSYLMKISITSLIECDSTENLEEYLSNRIAVVINNKDNQEKLLRYYSEYNNILNEIFDLYNEEKYRLCILSIMNFISIIFNECFDKKDFCEKKEIAKILEDKNYSLEDKYMLLAPYIEDTNNQITNTIIKNYKNRPSKYSQIPYNRNAITHGYSKQFGTKINCHRWFSVLFSTYELMSNFNIYNSNIENYFIN